MLLDPTTVAFQVINFLVLVAALRWLLFRPVRDAMEARRQRVEARLEEARELKAAAREAEQEFHRRQQQLALTREAVLAEARVEAEERRQLLLTEAEVEAREMREAGARRIQEHARELTRELGLRLGAQLQLLARRALTDLADVSLERQMVAALIQELEDFFVQHPAESLELTEGRACFVVRSASELPDEARRQLEAELARQLSRSVQLDFQVAPDLICGLELHTSGRSLGWNVRRYLEDLEADLAPLLHGEAAAVPATGPEEAAG